MKNLCLLELDLASGIVSLAMLPATLWHQIVLLSVSLFSFSSKPIPANCMCVQHAKQLWYSRGIIVQMLQFVTDRPTCSCLQQWEGMAKSLRALSVEPMVLMLAKGGGCTPQVWPLPGACFPVTSQPPLEIHPLTRPSLKGGQV